MTYWTCCLPEGQKGWIQMKLGCSLNYLEMVGC